MSESYCVKPNGLHIENRIQRTPVSDTHGRTKRKRYEKQEKEGKEMKKKYTFEAMHTDYGHWYGVHAFLDVTKNFKKYNDLRGRTFKLKGYMK